MVLKMAAATAVIALLLGLWVRLGVHAEGCGSDGGCEPTGCLGCRHKAPPG